MKEEKIVLIDGFDPEFSEYNPIFAEIENLREKPLQDKDKGFLGNLIDKLTFKLMVKLD